MPAANRTTTATAAMVPQGVDRFVTTEARAFRTALLFLPLTMDRPDLGTGRHPGGPGVLRPSSLGAVHKEELSSTPLE
jgi:hypothetical protein